MRTKGVIYLALAVGAAAAFAADTITRGGGVAPGPNPEWNMAAGTRELRWDNGTRKYFLCWYTGKDSWAGNDFSKEAAVKSSTIIKIRIFSSNTWPNERWDGFRVGIYEYDAQERKVGQMLWPTGGTGYFFKASGISGEGWVDVPVNWVAPRTDFVAAMEQVYDQPRCDPFAVDSNPKFLEHSWMYYAGTWKPLQTMSDPYFNLMLRVVVGDRPYWPAVEPVSLGRVKALYR